MPVATTTVTIISTKSAEDQTIQERILVTMVLVLEALTAIVLDLLCVVAIIRRRLHREEIRFLFMIVLALGEMLLGVSLLVQFVTGTNFMSINLTPLVKLGDVACNALIAGATAALSMGTFGLLLLTADQFMRIEFSLKYPTYATRRNAFIGIAISFAYVICNLSVLLAFSVKNGDPCLFGSYPSQYFFYALVSLLLLPFVLVALMNGRIWYLSITQFRKMKRTQRLGRLRTSPPHQPPVSDKLQNGSQDTITDTTEQLDIRIETPRDPKVTSNASPPPSRRHWKTTVTVAILVGSLVLCWAPLSVCLIVLATGTAHVPQIALELTTMLSLANYLLTPIIYIVRTPEVKAEFKRMFQQCRRQS